MILSRSVSHPTKVYPSFSGACGISFSDTLPLYSTSTSLILFPFSSSKVTLFLITSYSAVISVSPEILSSDLSHPVNVYPSFVGFDGAFADSPSLTSCSSKIVPSASRNVTLYVCFLVKSRAPSICQCPIFRLLILSHEKDSFISFSSSLLILSNLLYCFEPWQFFSVANSSLCISKSTLTP